MAYNNNDSVFDGAMPIPTSTAYSRLGQKCSLPYNLLPPDDEISKMKFELVKIVEDHLSCHICKWPCHQVVSANCGHKFCQGCLDKLKKSTIIRPKCPTCRGTICSTHRHHDDDKMMSSLMKNISQDMAHMYFIVDMRKTRRAKDASRIQLRRFRDIILDVVSILLGVILGVFMGILILCWMSQFICQNRDQWIIDDKIPVQQLREAGENFNRGMVMMLNETSAGVGQDTWNDQAVCEEAND